MPREKPPAEVPELVEMGEAEEQDQEERWARLLPELLSEVVRRVEASGGERWPARKDVVSCACVCRRFVRPPALSGKIPSRPRSSRWERELRLCLACVSLKQVRTGVPVDSFSPYSCYQVQ